MLIKNQIILGWTLYPISLKYTVHQNRPSKKCQLLPSPLNFISIYLKTSKIAIFPYTRLTVLHLMTDSAPHCAFFQREHSSHRFTFFTSIARFSGSLFMIWSNSANFPGRKKTLVRPNLNSFSFNPRALKRAWKEEV